MSTHTLTKKRLVFKQFNWRALLVRILVNALTLIITAFIIPTMGFVTPTIWKILLLAVALGLLNALIKPIIQFLTLSYIFATYGLVVIFISTIILYMLSWLMPGYFHVDNLLWAFIGGGLMGILAGFLESVFGLTLPIVDEESVSEPMRKATEFNERKMQQVFPFAEIEEENVQTAPALAGSDNADAVKIMQPNADQQPVPVAASPEVTEKKEEAMEIPVIEEGSPAVETLPAESQQSGLEEEKSAPAPAAGDDITKENEEITPGEADIAESQDDPQQGGAA